MASSSNHCEGLSTSKPPLFNGLNYDYWKKRMRIYLQSNDLKYWTFILNSYTPPNDDEIVSLTKPKIKEAEMNSRIMNILYCGLNEGEYNRVRGCESAYDIWHTLAMHHEGSTRLKETRINLLMHKYELFRMQSGENISEMHTRFTEIINSLKALGKDFSKGEMTRKILRSLTEDWEEKTTAIEEAQDLTKLSVEELMGSLMTYEIQMKDRKEKRVKKSLGLHAVTNSIKGDSDIEEQLATQQFKEFLKEEKERRKEKKSKRKEKKKKALKATWDTSSSSSLEEFASLCFMARKDDESEVSSSSSYNSNSSNNSNDYNELQNEFNELLENFEKVCEKNKLAKKNINELQSQIKSIMNEKIEILASHDKIALENTQLVDKITSLNASSSCDQNIQDLIAKNVRLQRDLERFTNGKKMLDMLISSQRQSLDKHGIGFYANNFKNHVIHTTLNGKHFVVNKTSSSIWAPKTKMVWVPKTNMIGPKQKWVPKSSIVGT